MVSVGALVKRMFGLLPIWPSVPLVFVKFTVEPVARAMLLPVRLSAAALTPVVLLVTLITLAPSVVVMAPSVSAEFQFARPR